MCREESFTTYLKAFGYCVIRVPREDVKPLQIMSRNGRDLLRLGDLSTLLVKGGEIDLPQIKPDNKAANICGQRTSALSVGVGLSILGGVIGAMGGTTLGLDGKYKQARTVAFEFSDVLEDSIEIAKLDQYLTDADVSPFSRHVGALLEADRIYVTTATIKSNKFTVEARDSEKRGVELSVPEIQQIVGGNVEVSVAGQVTSKLTYEATKEEGKPLVFGFQAVQLFYDENHYTAFKPVPPGAVAAIRALGRSPEDRATWLMPEGPFVRLRD